MSTRAANPSGGVLTRGESGGDAAPSRRGRGAPSANTSCAEFETIISRVDNLLLPTDTPCAFFLSFLDFSYFLLYFLSRCFAGHLPERVAPVVAAIAAVLAVWRIFRAGLRRKKEIRNQISRFRPTACSCCVSSSFLFSSSLIIFIMKQERGK